MNLNVFKTKMISLLSEVQSLIETTSNPAQLELINGLFDSLCNLVSFLEDEVNIRVLQDYSERDADHRNLCPLDNLCESVLNKLDDIESLLKSETSGSFLFQSAQSQVASPGNWQKNSLILSSLTNKLRNSSFVNLLAAFKVLKHLEGHNKTLIILGPNGSGKTSFANYMKKLESHVKVIPASKPIRANGHIPSIYNSTLADFNEKLYSDSIPEENLLQKLIIGLCTEHDDIQSALGIIDSDLKSAEEIERLKSKNIYALKCNEIEMLLLDEAIFKKVLEQIFKEIREFDAFKEEFFVKINERKQYIIKRLVKTQIDEKLRHSIIDDKNNKTKEEIKTNLKNIFDDLDVDKMWTKCEEKITNIISEKDYENALRYCCLEHNEVINGVVKRFVSDYATLALGVLSTDNQLSTDIRNKYFPEIDV